MLVRDDFPKFMESVPRSVHRVQPDVYILSGLQLGAMQYFVANHATGVENPVVLVDQRYPRCSSVAGAVVGVPRFVRLASGRYPYCNERDGVEVVVVGLPPQYDLYEFRAVLNDVGVASHQAGSGIPCPVES